MVGDGMNAIILSLGNAFPYISNSAVVLRMWIKYELCTSGRKKKTVHPMAEKVQIQCTTTVL